jgi:GNAT superfamily N-acetyltransferase
MCKAGPRNEDSSFVPVKIRRARDGEAEEISNLVRDVVAEKYGHLLDEMPPVPDDAATWMGSWVAEAGSAIAGVGLATDDCIDDLWLRTPYRRRGIGAALLASLERQIAENGHSTARLRVVGQNEGALRFYQSHGWQIIGRYPHERWRFEMVDMVKELGAEPHQR